MRFIWVLGKNCREKTKDAKIHTTLRNWFSGRMEHSTMIYYTQKTFNFSLLSGKSSNYLNGAFAWKYFFLRLARMLFGKPDIRSNRLWNLLILKHLLCGFFLKTSISEYILIKTITFFFLLGIVSSTVLNSIELVWLKDDLF